MDERERRDSSLPGLARPNASPFGCGRAKLSASISQQTSPHESQTDGSDESEPVLAVTWTSSAKTARPTKDSTAVRRGTLDMLIRRAAYAKQRLVCLHEAEKASAAAAARCRPSLL